MELFLDFLKLILPSLFVLYAMFLTVRSFLNARLTEYKMSGVVESQKIVMPIKLQAYERLVLLLERTSPGHLIARLNNPQFNVAQFQQLLITEVRQEYHHNLSQQLYISSETWTLVSNSIEDIIALINEAAQSCDPEAKSVELVKRIFELSIQRDGISKAIAALKEEFRSLF